MFSSDPFASPSAARRTMRPSILAQSDVDALNAASTGAWLPDDIDLSDLAYLPADDFGGDDMLATGMPAAPTVRPEIEAAVRAALAAREAEEMGIREQLQQEAYLAGIEAGRADAEASARQAFSSAIEALWLATEEVRASETRWLGALQDNIVALSMAAARHVVGREIAADDTLARTLAASAIAEFPQEHPIHVRVNPGDLATLREAFEGARSGDIRWTSDARVERGGVVIEGRERIVDGRVDTALERLYRALSGHHA